MLNAPGTVLTLNQLRLRYPGSEAWTLDGLDLSLSSGDRLALVGPSGCGKSTVARAALQLLPPGSCCEGGLLLNGQDPRKPESLPAKKRKARQEEGVSAGPGAQELREGRVRRQRRCDQ